MELSKYYKTIQAAKLADYGPVHGSIVIMPYGMDIWNLIKEQLTVSLTATEHKQVYFPMFMPERFLEEEKEYIQGLSPKYFSVTKAGGKELSNPLVIRPTSETLACYMFAKWINSYRDLPLKVFQWCNIARWEEVTQPFIKGTEIQWLEGHTIHVSHKDALTEIKIIQDIFKNFFKETLCIPVSVGLESEGRKFVGSISTITFEAMTPTGRALQIGAIYDLGRYFTQHFNVSFSTENNTKEISWMTDWGLGFRLIGAVALLHGDMRGLRLPPAIAPTQVLILLLNSKSDQIQLIANFADTLNKCLNANGIRARVAATGNRAISQALSEWEMKGVPIIIPIGDAEIQTGVLQLHRRDRSPQKNIVTCTANELLVKSKTLLTEIMNTLYREALSHKQEHLLTSDSHDELQKLLEHNWVASGWCGDKTCEQKFTEAAGKILRFVEQDDSFVRLHPRCILCGAETTVKAWFAKNH